MKKILKFETKPYFTFFQSRGAMFGILQSYDNIKSWLFSKFVMCFDNDIDLQGDEWLTKCGALKRFKSRTYKINALLGIVDKEIRNAIDKNCYVYLFADEYYIQNKHPYKSYHYIHDVVIYGYDDSKRAFISIGYDKNGAYKEYSISYSDINKSIRSAILMRHNCALYRVMVNTDFEFRFNYIDYCDGLYKYLKQIALYKYEPVNGYNGICSWLSLKSHLVKVLDDSAEINVTQCRFIYEQKVYTYEQLVYVNSLTEGKLQDLLVDYKKISDKARSLFFLCVKFAQNNKRETLRLCINIISELFCDEYNILNCVFNRLIDCR